MSLQPWPSGMRRRRLEVILAGDDLRKRLVQFPGVANPGDLALGVDDERPGHEPLRGGRHPRPGHLAVPGLAALRHRVQRHAGVSAYEGDPMAVKEFVDKLGDKRG